MTPFHLGVKHLFYDLSDSQKIAFAAPYFGWGGGLKGFSGKTFSLFSLKILLNTPKSILELTFAEIAVSFCGYIYK